MSQPQEKNLALFIDFDNVALGARDARQRFDIQVLLQRVLEKGKIIIKRAYADWRHHKEYMEPLHEAAIELIEIPTPKQSGKNSADIRLVVDAMDLCYAKEHIDAFIIVSGDSDFSPLVSKLRENNKRVIGIGVKNSTSHLLVGNCDEFIFYDDIYRDAVERMTSTVSGIPTEKRKLFDFLLTTTQRLLQESRGNLYSSLIKDTMKRKRPDFNETKYGYATFGDVLEDAQAHGLLDVQRDQKAGGTWVVLGLGEGIAPATAEGGAVKPASAPSDVESAPGTSAKKTSRRSPRKAKKRTTKKAASGAPAAETKKVSTRTRQGGTKKVSRKTTRK